MMRRAKAYRGHLWFWPYLMTLPRFQVQLGLVVVALALSAIHDFVIGPRAGRPAADPRVRAQASWLGRPNLAIVLAIAPFELTLRA